MLVGFVSRFWGKYKRFNRPFRDSNTSLNRGNVFGADHDSKELSGTT